MKKKNEWFLNRSLQVRITLLTTLILLIVSIAITSFSIKTSDSLLTPYVDSVEQTKSSIDRFKTVEAASAEKVKKQFDYKSIIFCAFSVLTGSVSVYLISGHAIKPVKILKDQLSGIDENNLSLRIEKRQSKDEISEMTVSINRMLERIEDAFLRQKQFSASAAHELKTPLSIMKTNLQVLETLNNISIEDYKEANKIQLENLNRLNNLVNDLLLIANTTRIENFEQEIIDLEIIFQEIFLELSERYKETNIRYIIHLEEKNIIGQPDLLFRVFYNLIENAYKYNEENGKIWVHSFSDNMKSIVSIKNTGKKIPEEQKQLIMDPFYRVDKSWARKYSGAGLGLTIAKSIIDLHKGNIKITGNENTEFLVIFLREVNF